MWRKEFLPALVSESNFFSSDFAVELYEKFTSLNLSIISTVAVAGIDDATSVAAFGILASIIFSTGSLSYQISQAPVCIIGGVAFGVVWGQLLRIVPEKGDTYLVPIRTLMLLAGGALVVFGSEAIGYEGAGPLGAVFAAFVSNYYWCKEGLLFFKSHSTQTKSNFFLFCSVKKRMAN